MIPLSSLLTTSQMPTCSIFSMINHFPLFEVPSHLRRGTWSASILWHVGGCGKEGCELPPVSGTNRHHCPYLLQLRSFTPFRTPPCPSILCLFHQRTPPHLHVLRSKGWKIHQTDAPSRRDPRSIAGQLTRWSSPTTHWSGSRLRPRRRRLRAKQNL